MFMEAYTLAFGKILAAGAALKSALCLPIKHVENYR